MRTGASAEGEGCSDRQSREEPPVDLNEGEGEWDRGEEAEHVVGEGSGAESQEEVPECENESIGEGDDGCEDGDDCPRLTPRNRKCFYAASKVVTNIMQCLDAGFSDEEKKMVLDRVCVDDRIRAVHPEWCMAVQKLRTVPATTVQSLRGALQTLRNTTIQGKAKVRNIVLTAAVSNGESQRMICKALGASRYLVRKAYQRRAEVDETGENLWAGRDRKRRSDALSAEEHGAVSSWWETETTVSPNKKDVKRRRIAAKEHEEHATHYLQVSQVQSLLPSPYCGFVCDDVGSSRSLLVGLEHVGVH